MIQAFIVRVLLPLMKDFIVLGVGLFLFYSCGSESEKQVSDFPSKFQQSFGSDSLEWVKTVRTEIARQSPQSDIGLYSKAWLLAQNGDRSRALKTADSLVMGFPAFDKGLYLRANLRMEQNDPDGALHDFDKAIKKNPDFFEAYINRGSLHFKLGHTEMALKDFEKAFTLKANQKQVFLNLGNAYISLGDVTKACTAWQKADSLSAPEAKALLVKFCTTKP